MCDSCLVQSHTYTHHIHFAVDFFVTVRSLLRSWSQLWFSSLETRKKRVDFRLISWERSSSFLGGWRSLSTGGSGNRSVVVVLLSCLFYSFKSPMDKKRCLLNTSRPCLLYLLRVCFVYCLAIKDRSPVSSCKNLQTAASPTTELSIIPYVVKG